MCMQISPIHITFDLKLNGFYGVGKAYLHAFKRITISPAILLQPRTVYRWTKEIYSILLSIAREGWGGVGLFLLFIVRVGWDKK